MKFILYFYYYSLFSTQYHIRTAVYRDNDSLCFYLYDVGYVNWHIDHVVKETITIEEPSYFGMQKECRVNAIYLISRGNKMKGIAHITSNICLITLMFEGNVIHLQLKYKSKLKQQKL
jgi:hypothetical protein